MECVNDWHGVRNRLDFVNDWHGIRKRLERRPAIPAVERGHVKTGMEYVNAYVWHGIRQRLERRPAIPSVERGHVKTMPNYAITS